MPIIVLRRGCRVSDDVMRVAFRAKLLCNERESQKEGGQTFADNLVIV